MKKLYIYSTVVYIDIDRVINDEEAFEEAVKLLVGDFCESEEGMRASLQLITEESQLPLGYDSGCLPWGTDSLTIGKILSTNNDATEDDIIIINGMRYRKEEQ